MPGFSPHSWKELEQLDQGWLGTPDTWVLSPCWVELVQGWLGVPDTWALSSIQGLIRGCGGISITRFFTITPTP